MGYARRPFNPLTPTPNQVITELNQANENFNILAQAFLSDNPETLVVKNADKVDDFHASTTPAPFTIPVAGADGKIALGWLPDSILSGGSSGSSGGGGYRRIDMRGITSDYDLQVGEEAYYEWDVGNASSTYLPLRITVSGRFYQLIIVSRYTVPTTGITPVLYPNNTSYTDPILGQFRLTLIEFGGIETSIRTLKQHYAYFRFNAYASSSSHAPQFIINALINTSRIRKSIIYMSMGFSSWYPSIKYGAYFWDNPDVEWTSLGTLACDNYSCGAVNDYFYVLVRRLI
jgi:hypothetical protein